MKTFIVDKHLEFANCSLPISRSMKRIACGSLLIALAFLFSAGDNTAYAKPIQKPQAVPATLPAASQTKQGSEKKQGGDSQEGKPATIGDQRGSQTTPAEKTPHKKIDSSFGANPNKPVFVFDITSGKPVPPGPGYRPTPLLTIYPDGRVVAGGKHHTVKVCEKIISEEELKKFLQFAIEECRFFDWSSASIQNEIAAKGVTPLFADGGKSCITINLDNHQHKIGVYCLGYIARKMQGSPSVGGIDALVKKARYMIARTKIRPEEQGEALTAVNAALAKKDATAPEFTEEDLTTSEKFENGRIKASFTKQYKLDGKNKKIGARFELSPEGQPKASIQTYKQQ